MNPSHDANASSHRGLKIPVTAVGRRLLLILLDAGCYFGAYLMMTVFTLATADIGSSEWNDVVIQKLPHMLLLLTFLLAGRWAMLVYRNVWRYPNVRAYLTLVISDVCSGTLAFLTSFVLSRAAYVPHIFNNFWRTFCVIVLFTLSTLVMRFCYQLIHHRNNLDTREGASGKIGVAIIGAGQTGCHLVDELRSTSSRYQPLCFLDRDPNKIGMRVADLNVYAEHPKTLDILKSLPVQEIFVAISTITPEENARLIKLYNDAGYKVKLYDFPVREDADGNTAPGGRGLVRNFRVEDLLGRESLDSKLNRQELLAYYSDRVVLVTGGGGSIGSEICRQIAKCQPKHLIILDIYENNAYDIQQELVRKYGDKLNVSVEIASVRDVTRMDCIFDAYRPNIVFHAAAHKHVPLMEHSSCEAIKNNVMGTYNSANMAEKYGVEKFVLISTDKAVNPTNVMGASKRMCEMVVQCRTDSKTAFTAVRFGNVLGSNGSVIPLFRGQIEMGGPVTITDKRIIRYFMTIPEAAGLVLTAGSMAKDGELFVLDMGKPMRILDLAENMIRMMGYVPYQDIDIQEIGLRPGEKLFEELLIKSETLKKTSNDLIFIEQDTPLTREEVEAKLDILREAVKAGEQELAAACVKQALKQVVPTFREPNEINSHAEETDEVKAANEVLV